VDDGDWAIDERLVASATAAAINAAISERIALAGILLTGSCMTIHHGTRGQSANAHPNEQGPARGRPLRFKLVSMRQSGADNV
jgi:hypothetical protein